MKLTSKTNFGVSILTRDTQRSRLRLAWLSTGAWPLVCDIQAEKEEVRTAGSAPPCQTETQLWYFASPLSVVPALSRQKQEILTISPPLSQLKVPIRTFSRSHLLSCTWKCPQWPAVTRGSHLRSPTRWEIPFQRRFNANLGWFPRRSLSLRRVDKFMRRLPLVESCELAVEPGDNARAAYT